MTIELVFDRRREWWFCPVCGQVLCRAKQGNVFEWVKCPDCDEVGEKREARLHLEPAY